MRKLKFYNEYVNSIKEGIKTSTIRTHFDAQVGDILGACPSSSFKPFGFIRIKEIKYIRFDDIDKDIARTEGYLHEDFLKESLYGIYEDLEDSTLLYYIVFEFKEDANDFGMVKN
ncbi:MAG: ASCH domain-containing protein [Methanobrevibacter ruminantium]|uniref:ASCH domain-containing protein n=1 Tax=Methanobrevibacter ruminantium TaxID=83816 RepID=UPI0026EF1F63|nr:ASCH domain-containing protein [Methanobrevibacter ruminantium]MDO5841754.1 ASCH domain-containing protein [Methanobrevibacter ruminantium]